MRNERKVTKTWRMAENTDLSTVKVLDDSEVQTLLPLPLALHLVTQKLP